jgi:hypothetical protein
MSGDAPLPLSQHDILDPLECRTTRDRVMGLRDRWTKRSDAGFFTLGAASYLDAPENLAGYLRAAQTSNRFLHASFGDLLERVRVFFEDLLGDAVSFDDDYAVPGFHIYFFDGGDRSADDVTLRAHFDLQWAHLIPDDPPKATVSFTLPIEEPSGGSSMEVWHIRYRDVVQLGMSARSYASKHGSQVVSYAPGRVVVHDGFVLHAIGRASVPAPTGYRITMQGHGLKTAHGWTLYW